jgi:microcystin-dependent protein
MAAAVCDGGRKCDDICGGDQPHNNMQPYLTLNFCIALQGVFPPRG